MHKIAHISDLHVGFKDENGHGIKLVELLTDIKEKKCDHVILTGDIADNPNIKDFVYVKEILSHFDLLGYSKMSLIPGNHDIFGGAPPGSDFFRFPEICSQINYDENVDVFIDMFKDTFPSNNSFPYLKVIDNIAVIGINSVDRWSTKKNPEGSNGKITKDDYEKLKSLLSSEEIKDKYKLVLIHHHFNKAGNSNEYPAHSLWLKVVTYKMKLYGKKKLIELFKKHKVNLVMHGHTHINEIYNVKGISILNSSACVYPITDDGIRKYNIISVPGEGDADKTISIETIIL